MEKFKLIKLIGLVIALTALVSPALISATNGAPTVFTTGQGLLDFISKIVNWMFAILMIVAVVFLIFAAFSFLTAAGDPEKIGKAKTQLIYAIVAIGVAVLARGIVFVVQNIITGV